MLKYLISLLDDHAGAIQALTAVAVVVLTYFLVRVTSKYTRITGEIAEVTKRQLLDTEKQLEIINKQLVIAQKELSASMQPVLKIDTYDYSEGCDAGSDNVILLCTLEITNTGHKPVKLLAVTAITYFDDSLPYNLKLTEKDNTVMMPDDVQRNKLSVITHLKVVEANAYDWKIEIDCTDLAGVSEHSFVYDGKTNQLRHFLGFKHNSEAVS